MFSFLLLLLVLVPFIIAWFAAKEFYEIAKMKGHFEKKYFWWCFWIGMIGWPMVIALPDRGATSGILDSVAQEFKIAAQTNLQQQVKIETLVSLGEKELRERRTSAKEQLLMAESVEEQRAWEDIIKSIDEALSKI